MISMPFLCPEPSQHLFSVTNTTLSYTDWPEPSHKTHGKYLPPVLRYFSDVGNLQGKLFNLALIQVFENAR